MFLGFANFYTKFIRNFNRIIALLTFIFWRTNKQIEDEAQSTQFGNPDALDAASRIDRSGVSESIKNLSTVVNLAKSKKSKLTKPKNSDISNLKANSRTDFLISGAKKAFIYLQKTFIEVLIFIYFDPERHIWIEIDVSGYAIGGVLSQMTLDYLDQLFSDHVTHKTLNPIFFKSEISQ